MKFGEARVAYGERSGGVYVNKVLYPVLDVRVRLPVPEGEATVGLSKATW